MAVNGDVYRCSLFLSAPTGFGQPIQALNIRHYVVNQTDGNGATDTAIANAIFNICKVEYGGILPVQATFVKVEVRRVFPPPISLATRSTELPVQGVRVLDLLPPQVSGIITLTSPLAGRRNRGRMYVPFPGESDNDNTGPTIAYFNLLNTLAQRMILPVTAGALPNDNILLPCVFRAVPTPGFQILTGVTTRSYWATQRRRAVLYGPDVVAFA